MKRTSTFRETPKQKTDLQSKHNFVRLFDRKHVVEYERLFETNYILTEGKLLIIQLSVYR